jgi:hypothetical protein
MEPLLEPTNTVWSFPFAPQDWAQTPPAVQAYVRTLRDEVAQLHDRVETLQARLTQNSTTSSRPPSADSPYKPVVLVAYILDNYVSILQTKFSDREGHEARRIGL